MPEFDGQGQTGAADGHPQGPAGAWRTTIGPNREPDQAAEAERHDRRPVDRCEERRRARRRRRWRHPGSRSCRRWRVPESHSRAQQHREQQHARGRTEDSRRRCRSRRSRRIRGVSVAVCRLVAGDFRFRAGAWRHEDGDRREMRAEAGTTFSKPSAGVDNSRTAPIDPATAATGAMRLSHGPWPSSSGREPRTDPIPLNTRATVLVTFAVTGGSPTISNAG